MNRIVLITGASSGYGKAMAKAFKDSGDILCGTFTPPSDEKIAEFKQILIELGMPEWFFEIRKFKSYNC